MNYWINSSELGGCTRIVMVLPKTWCGASPIIHNPLCIGSGSFNSWASSFGGGPGPGPGNCDSVAQLVARHGWAWLGMAGQLTTGTFLRANGFGHLAVEAELPDFGLEAESRCLNVESQQGSNAGWKDSGDVFDVFEIYMAWDLMILSQLVAWYATEQPQRLQQMSSSLKVQQKNARPSDLFAFFLNTTMERVQLLHHLLAS